MWEKYSYYAWCKKEMNWRRLNRTRVCAEPHIPCPSCTATGLCIILKWKEIRRYCWIKVDEREEIWDWKLTNFPTVEGTELWKSALILLNLNDQQLWKVSYRGHCRIKSWESKPCSFTSEYFLSPAFVKATVSMSLPYISVIMSFTPQPFRLKVVDRDEKEEVGKSGCILVVRTMPSILNLILNSLSLEKA